MNSNTCIQGYKDFSQGTWKYCILKRLLRAWLLWITAYSTSPFYGKMKSHVLGFVMLPAHCSSGFVERSHRKACVRPTACQCMNMERMPTFQSRSNGAACISCQCICKIKSKTRNVVPLEHGNIWRTKIERKLDSHSINLMKFENKKRCGFREIWVLVSSCECWLRMILRHHFLLTISHCNLSYFFLSVQASNFMTSGC